MAKKGIDKLRATAKKIEKDTADKKVEAENALAEVQANPEMAKMYQDNAEVGSENLGGSLPLLKVHAMGKSITNELEGGGEPKDGNFYYKQTQEEFKSVEIHVLTISRGFRADGFKEEGKTPKQVFNQIVAGVIMDDKEMKPFVAYFTGLKLPRMWDFGKEASKYTKAKPFPIPMFALKVKLTTEKVSHKFGNSWVINFEIVKDDEGVPVVVTDPGLFTYLKDHVETVQSTIDSLIANKATEEVAENKGGEPPHPGGEDSPEVKAAREVFGGQDQITEPH